MNSVDILKIEYSNAYSEVLEVLSYLSKEDYNKVPQDMIELLKTHCNPQHGFRYDIEKEFKEQPLSKKAKIVLAILFRDYWATPDQRKKIKDKEKYDIQKLEEQKREMYNVNDLFKKTEQQNYTKKQLNNLPVKVEKETLLQRLINCIRKLLRI